MNKAFCVDSQHGKVTTLVTAKLKLKSISGPKRQSLITSKQLNYFS